MQKELAPAASAVSLMWRQRGAAFGVLFLVAAAAASPSLDPSSVFTGSSSPSAAASEQQRSPAGAEGGASAAAGQCAAAGGECGASQQDEAENRIHKLADGMQQQSSGAAGSREAAQALSWWDALMLALLLLLVLSSSASVFSGSSFESCCLRLCQAWPPLRRFLRLRKRSRVKLQILAAQYERVCEERARLANYLKKQACKIEKALQKIRSRHAKQLAESGVLRMLTRFFSKSKRPGEAATSSDSSDSEAWSTSTVESLLQQRLHADAADSSPSASSSACFSSSLSSHVGEQQEEADIASEGQPSAATRRPAAARPCSAHAVPADEPCVSESSIGGRESELGSEGFAGSRLQLDSDEGGAPLFGQLPGSSTDHAKLSQKLQQLSQRKAGTLNRLVRQSQTNCRQTDGASWAEPLEEGKEATSLSTGL